MWIVNIALKRPYTFVVLALLILLVSPLVIMRTPTDIFPNVNIPVIAVLWNYNGLSAEEMEERIGWQFERLVREHSRDSIEQLPPVLVRWVHLVGITERGLDLDRLAGVQIRRHGNLHRT